MRTVEQVSEEIAALRNLAAKHSNAETLASIAGQINALLWASNYQAQEG